MHKNQWFQVERKRVALSKASFRYNWSYNIVIYQKGVSNHAHAHLHPMHPTIRNPIFRRILSIKLQLALSYPLLISIFKAKSPLFVHRYPFILCNISKAIRMLFWMDRPDMKADCEFINQLRKNILESIE